MPELPEVECLRRGLAELIVGRIVRRFEVFRVDYIQGDRGDIEAFHGVVLSGVHRYGKQLALEVMGPAGCPCLCVHLGMSGTVRMSPDIEIPPMDPHARSRLENAKKATVDDAGFSSGVGDGSHVHAAMVLEGGGRVVFRDPRRFGGIWVYPDIETLKTQRWRTLGPDALEVSASQLHGRLSRTGRAIKVALMDQAVVAGLGNIYTDESLFAAGIHPLRASNDLDLGEVRKLRGAIRRILQRAIRAGGSTLRDYVAVTGRAGGFQDQHMVYGRAGQRCKRCGGLLGFLKVGGRTTVTCGRCQASPQDRLKG